MLIDLILRVAQRAGIPFRPMILCYHQMDPEILDSHVRLLRRAFRCVRVDKITVDQRNVIAFTMDDCRATDVESWDRITRDHDIPATIFVPIRYHLDGSALWSDKLRALIEANEELTWEEQRYSLRSSEERAVCFEAVKTAIFCGAENTAEVESRLDVLLERHGVTLDPGTHVMQPERMHRILENPRLSVASHSMTHAFLAKSSDTEIDEELSASAQSLRERYGSSFVDVFCFPYGTMELIGSAALGKAARHYRGSVLLDESAVHRAPQAMGRIGLYDKDTPLRVLLKILRAQALAARKADVHS